VKKARENDMTNNKTVAAPSTITPVFVPKPVRSLVPPPSAFGIEIGALYEADDEIIQAWSQEGVSVEGWAEQDVLGLIALPEAPAAAETLLYTGIITDGEAAATVMFHHQGKPTTSDVWLASDSDCLAKVFPKGCGLYVSEIRAGERVVFSEADYES